MIDYEQMGKTIRKYRKAMGISQEKLAEIMRLSREYISRLECSKATVSLDTWCSFQEYWISLWIFWC